MKDWILDFLTLTGAVALGVFLANIIWLVFKAAVILLLE